MCVAYLIIGPAKRVIEDKEYEIAIEPRKNQLDSVSQKWAKPVSFRFSKKGIPFR